MSGMVIQIRLQDFCCKPFDFCLFFSSGHFGLVEQAENQSLHMKELHYNLTC